MSHNYFTEEGIRRCFESYLIRYQNCTKEDAKLAASDFPDDYNLPYLRCEYEAVVEINGKKYEQYLYWTDFTMFDTFDNNTVFKYYEYVPCDELPDKTVGSYMAATKKYEVYHEEGCQDH